MEGNRLFLYAAATPTQGETCTLVQIHQAHFMPDGKANITGEGIQQVQMHQVAHASHIWHCSMLRNARCGSRMGPMVCTMPRSACAPHRPKL